MHHLNSTVVMCDFTHNTDMCSSAIAKLYKNVLFEL